VYVPILQQQQNNQVGIVSFEAREEKGASKAGFRGVELERTNFEAALVA
jgi:hypothetical protein